MSDGCRSAGGGVSPEEACGAVHDLLKPLPVVEQPGGVSITDGLYFFYEEGESSSHASEGRIVRVGNHPRSDGTLVRRLRQHYRGGKNGSVFRKFLGGALMRAESPSHPCLAPGPGQGHWERQDEKPCDHCRPVEQRVSRLLRTSFRFRCVFIPGRMERNRFEALLIASLSSCSICGPSCRWLGHSAYSEVVRNAGMWNSQFVGGVPMTSDDLRRFAEHVASTSTG